MKPLTHCANNLITTVGRSMIIDPSRTCTSQSIERKPNEASHKTPFPACKKTRLLWWNLENAHGVQHLSHFSIAEAFLWCSLQKKSWRSIFIITLWCIWKWCNKVVFNGKVLQRMEILSSITSIFESIPQSSSKILFQKESVIQQDLSVIPRAFFDGAEQEGQCGCGVYIVVLFLKVQRYTERINDLEITSWETKLFSNFRQENYFQCNSILWSNHIFLAYINWPWSNP